MRNEMKSASGGKKIKVTENGPYLVEGNVSICEEEVVVDENKDPLKWKKTKKHPTDETCLLCRCGKSKSAPFCDSTHLKIKFDGKESKNAQKKYKDLQSTYVGPKIDLHDAEDLCAGVGFCHRKGGTWDLIERGTQESKEIAMQQSCDCPSGRLVTAEKSGKIVEPKFSQEIGVVQEPERGVSGPLWVKGGIPVESVEGKQYEKRNRVALCRCGRSNNKPFCDGMHHFAKFDDGTIKKH